MQSHGGSGKTFGRYKQQPHTCIFPAASCRIGIPSSERRSCIPVQIEIYQISMRERKHDTFTDMSRPVARAYGANILIFYHSDKLWGCFLYKVLRGFYFPFHRALQTADYQGLCNMYPFVLQKVAFRAVVCALLHCNLPQTAFPFLMIAMTADAGRLHIRQCRSITNCASRLPRKPCGRAREDAAA